MHPLLVLGIAVSAFFLSQAEARAAEQWYVELVGQQLDESQIRLAISLELREVEIPGDPERTGDDFRDVSLRILVEQEGDFIEVSLWDRGTFTGRRRVSKSAQPRILARRVGLAVGELGRQLAGHRVRVAHRLEREKQAEEQRRALASQRARKRDLGLGAGLDSMVFPQGAWLMGPRLAVEFNGYYPVRFVPQVSWLAGALPALSDATSAETAPHYSAWELGLGVDYVWEWAPRSRLVFGGALAGSTIHTGGATTVDDIVGQRDTWSARAGARVSYEWQASSDARLQIALSGGSLLRRIPMRRGSTSLDLGGGFVGLSAGVTLAPRREDH